jgi:ADP-ribose pyrophosphatase
VQVGAGGGDASEDILVHRVPRAHCAAFLATKMAEGYSIDPKLYAGLYFIEFDAAGRAWRDV